MDYRQLGRIRNANDREANDAIKWQAANERDSEGARLMDIKRAIAWRSVKGIHRLDEVFRFLCLVVAKGNGYGWREWKRADLTVECY